MKYTIQSFIPLLVLLFQPFQYAKAQEEKVPKISYKELILMYGDIEYNSDGEREWHFTNTGNAPLLITSTKGSCGCTVAKYPKAAILPGKSSTVKIKYDTKRVGLISKTVTITTNEPEGKNVHVVTIMGRVKEAPAKPGNSKPK